MTTDSQAVCAKAHCGHVLYQHENADLTPGKCRYPGCRCRLFRPETMDEMLDRLGVGKHRLPPDDEVYSRGPVVFIPSRPAATAEPETKDS